MIVAIHQPQFMPWLGYFDKMNKCDVFVFLDNVQYKKNEYQNRNRIKTSQGWQWLTVPVNYRYPQKINKVAVHNGFDWRKKHLHAIETSYGRSPYFNRYIDRLREFYNQKWSLLSEVNIASVMFLKESLGITTRIVTASEMDELNDEPTQRLANICAKLGGDTYLAGRDGSKYMDMDIIRNAGINVEFQNFNHPLYPQIFGGFEKYMSALDLIFNCADDSMEILKRGGTS